MEAQQMEILNGEQAVIDKVKAGRDALYRLRGKAMFEINEKIADFCDELSARRPDARQYYLFHVLTFSTVDRERCGNFDFPGEDSVVKKIDDLLGEYKAE